VRRATPAKTTTSVFKTSPAASVLRLAASSGGQLKYDTESLETKAGAVSIDFTNRSLLAHNVTVASSSGRVIGSTPTFQGGSRTLHLILKPGSYKFYCSVPGHRMAGMQGTLTVR
jgi:plastocyanin